MKLGYFLSCEENGPAELVRQAKLAEAGGKHYTVEDARIYDLPDEPPPVLVSGFGEKSVQLAARIGDGYCTTAPDAEMIELYRGQGGKGPVQAGTKVCFGQDEGEARQIAH